VQTLDYYPYGATRVSVGTSTDEARKFIGQFADQSTLDYLNARYYSSDRGQFISQDPTFLAIGNPSLLGQLAQQDQARFLMDPQLANSYNYGRDNPISLKDPLGLAAKIFEDNAVVSGLEYYGYYDLGKQGINLLVKGPTATEDEKAQFRVDLSLATVGALPKKVAQRSEAAFMTVGGTALQAIDAYCSSNVCLNFVNSQPSSAQTILNNLNNGSALSLKAINSTLTGNTQKTYWGQTQQSYRGGNSSQHSGASYSRFSSSLSGFVSSLSAYVGSLKPSASGTKSTP
jgi:RHS repeat-associated protein